LNHLFFFLRCCRYGAWGVTIRTTLYKP
jgi:hypothetical protein